MTPENARALGALMLMANCRAGDLVELGIDVARYERFLAMTVRPTSIEQGLLWDLLQLIKPGQRYLITDFTRTPAFDASGQFALRLRFVPVDEGQAVVIVPHDDDSVGFMAVLIQGSNDDHMVVLRLLGHMERQYCFAPRPSPAP